MFGIIRFSRMYRLKWYNTSWLDLMELCTTVCENRVLLIVNLKKELYLTLLPHFYKGRMTKKYKNIAVKTNVVF